MLTCRRSCYLHLRLRCELPVGVVSYQLTLRARPLLRISCGCGCIEVAVASAYARRGRSRQEHLRRCGGSCLQLQLQLL